MGTEAAIEAGPLGMASPVSMSEAELGTSDRAKGDANSLAEAECIGGMRGDDLQETFITARTEFTTVERGQAL